MDFVTHVFFISIWHEYVLSFGTADLMMGWWVGDANRKYSINIPPCALKDFDVPY